jgi:hypothetical protein
MEQSPPWEADNGSDGQEISSKDHHCVQSNPPLDPILNQTSPHQILTTHFFNIQFNNNLHLQICAHAVSSWGIRN